MSFNIAIDGPAGAGKSTIAKQVAKELSYIYVDTGAMYRAMALHFLRSGIVPEDVEAIERVCEDVRVAIAYQEGEQRVLLNDEDVSAFLRTEEVGNMASATSVHGCVRAKLTQLQKELAAKQNVVMDGRDIGTAVLPHAQVKIYLTASVETRAQRRYKELLEKGMPEELSAIEADIRERDYRDMNREISPLCQAEDALLLDSSDLTINEVVQTILNVCRNADK